jgi:hypothetical protein
VTRTQRRAVLAVVAVFVAAPFLLAGGLAVFRAIHSPWPEPVPGVRLDPRVPFLAPGDPVPTNDAFHILVSFTNLLADMKGPRIWPTHEWQRFEAGGIASGPFPGLERLVNHVSNQWPHWDRAADMPGGRAPEPDCAYGGGARLLGGCFLPLRIDGLAASNQWSAVLRACRSGLRNSRHIRMGQTLVHHFTGMEVGARTVRSIERCICLHDVPACALDGFALMLAEHDTDRPPLAEALRGELHFALKCASDVYRLPEDEWYFTMADHGHELLHCAVGRMVLRIAGSTPERSRRHVMASYSHLILCMERPDFGRHDPACRLVWTPESIFAQEPPLSGEFLVDDPIGAEMMLWLTPTVWSLAWAVHTEDALLRGVRTLVAIERFRRANGGSAPESLGTLVPAWLPAVPADPFDPDGGPLRYVPGRAPWLLYSVGTNGVDDTARGPDGAPSTNDMHFGRAYLDQLRAFLTNTNAPKQ